VGRDRRAAGRSSGGRSGARPDSTILVGDCVEVMAGLEPESVDAVVTDPPYAIGRLQDERWDQRAIREAAARSGHDRLGLGEAYGVWCREWAEACLRVLKPGGHLLAFGSARTAHRLTSGIEDAGLEVRDVLMWLYATGMPKSRRLAGDRGTTLKPAYEPIVLARRRPECAVEANIERHGTGALEIGAYRVEGRHPANVVVSHNPACGERCEADCAVRRVQHAADRRRRGTPLEVSRVFYCPKVSRRERDAGCEKLPNRRLDLFPQAEPKKRKRAARNPHPTVKPLELMRWLVRLVCPPDGLVLDPFCGSGTTGAAAALEGHRFLGIEREPAFVEIAAARIEHWASTRTDCAPLGRRK
jgi:DNA modification methylase